MGTIYQKIKGAAEAKRRSFVSLGSEDGTVSPTKINQTLVEGSKGMGKKFVDHSNAVMDGYNSTINEAGASFGNNLITDFKNRFKADSGGGSGKDGSVKTAAEKKKEADALAAENGVKPIDTVADFKTPAKVKSPARATAADEAAEGVKGTKTRRKNPDGTDTEYDYEGVASTVDDVVNITKGEDVVGDYSTDWDEEKYGSYKDWIKKPGNQAQSDKFMKSITTPGEDKEVKSVEINPLDEKKEETTETPGTEKTYNMGWMESRNASRATNVQRRQANKTTRKNERLIKRFENAADGNNKDTKRMPPEVRGAYEHFSNPDKRTNFDSPISTHSGRDKAATSETVVEEGPKSGKGKPKIDSDANPIAEYKSAARTLTSGAKYKMKGSSLKR